MTAHFDFPFPAPKVKDMLSDITGMSRHQVSNWFVNHRGRVWQPLVLQMAADNQKVRRRPPPPRPLPPPLGPPGAPLRADLPQPDAPLSACCAAADCAGTHQVMNDEDMT